MKTTRTTLTRAARVEAVLAADNETTTELAREYLTGEIECRGEGETFADKVEDFAAHEYPDSAFGINVIEDDDGDQFLVYGDMQYQCGGGSTWCSIDIVLDIIEAGDSTPDWWEDEWTAVNPDGYGYTTKQRLAYLEEHEQDCCED